MKQSTKNIVIHAAVIAVIWILLDTLCNLFLPENHSILTLLASAFTAGIIISIVLNRINSKTEDTIESVLHAMHEEALSTTGLMTAGLAHNFMNYLQVMENTLLLMEKYKDDLTRQGKALALQKKCIKQAQETVGQLMFFVSTKDLEGLKESRPINEIVADSLDLAEMLLQEKQIHLVKDFEFSEYTFPGNDIALMHSIINLVKNAGEASPEGSCIRVSTKFKKNGDAVELYLTVKDSGRGIDKQQLNRMFQPFHSFEKDSGTGLGLYMVKHMVEQTGGTVDFNTSSSGGTEFVLHYPSLN